MSEHEEMSGWRRFWERGGWWKALIVAAVYYVLYQLAGLALGALLGPALGEPGTVQNLLLTVALPIAIGGVILVVFALSIGWLRELFGPQPIRGHWWMWIAVGAVLLFNVLRFASLDYGKAGFAMVAAWLLSGLFIGFAEELLIRGFVVNLLRKAGHREIVVALISSAVFAALHAGNLLTGQALLPTLFQLGYTFAFGLCMYLALRVTGNLIWPILLHASTDPSIFLLTSYPGTGPLTAFAGFGNIVVIVVGLVLLIFIRGRVRDPLDAHPVAR